MKKLILWFIFLMSLTGFSQNTLSELLKKYNTQAIPYIYVEELAHHKNEFIILDAREPKEFNISHLKDAIYVGYNTFTLDSVKTQIQNKNKKIVVYCSLGIRSEVIGIKLKNAGYTNVQNLYGGIFEWKNQDLPIYTTAKKETDSIHGYSKSWSKWLLKGTKILD